MRMVKGYFRVEWLIEYFQTFSVSDTTQSEFSVFWKFSVKFQTSIKLPNINQYNLLSIVWRQCFIEATSSDFNIFCWVMCLLFYFIRTQK